MTPEFMIRYIGEVKTISYLGMKFNVRIIGYSTAYGRIRFKIEPVNGIGTANVNDETLGINVKEDLTTINIL